MNKLGKVAVALAMAFSVGAAFGYTSASYVQDGLVHQWDGIENAGVGLSDTTTSVWVDLKGDADLTLKDEKSQFTGNALTRSVLNYAYAKADTAITGVKTVEVTFRRAAYQKYAVIVSLEGYKDNGRGLLTMKDDGLGSTYHGYHDSYDATHCEFVTVALYADVAKGADNLFVDGVALPSTTVSEGWSSGMANEFTLGGRWSSSSGNCFSGEIFSCRLYDRYLSSEELVKNAKVDAIRFNGASGGDALTVKGTPEDYGEVSPAYGTTNGLTAGDGLPCVAMKVWTNETETVAANCVGYKVLVDGVVSEEKTFGEADEAAFDYVHPDCIVGAELVWRWTTKYRVQAETIGGGTVEVSGDGWFAPGETVTVTAEYDADVLAIRSWDGVSGTMDGDTFTFVMPPKPVVCTAKMSRLYAVAVTGDDGEELDAIAEFRGVLDVRTRKRADAFDLHLVERRLEAVRERGEDARLVGGVEAVDVERRIRLGVTELLRVLEDHVEGKPLVLHPREDVVAGAVQDAVDRLDVVAGEALAQDADDRNAAAHRRAEVDVDAVRLRRVEDLLAVLREKLLVGRHDALLRVERVEDELLRNARAADRLDDNPDLGIGDRRRRVRRQHFLRHGNAAVRRDVEIRDLPKDDVDAETPRHHLAMLQKPVRDARADGAEPENANSDLLHVSPSFQWFFILYQKFSQSVGHTPSARPQGL